MKKKSPDNYFAALDLGTNSFHLIIAKTNNNNNLKVIEKEREVIRLGSEYGTGLNLISGKEFQKAINILKKFKKLINKYDVKMRAVATSAVREAENKNDFIEKVLIETGINIEIINGYEEAKLIYFGAEKALSLKDKKALCIDIGGGSTEFILSDKGNIIFAESIKIGAVRLTKKFFPDFVINNERIKECNNFIEKETLSNKNINLNENFDLAVGSSGTIEAAAIMINFRKQNKFPDQINGFVFDYNDLKELIENILNKKTANERLQVKGMETKRADIIPAGLLILNKIFELFNLKNIKVSDYALREGIIFDMIN